jgi:hypothetical protein
MISGSALILAQAFYAAWGIAQWAIAIIIVAGIVAVVVIILKAFEIQIPAWFIKILWVLLAVVVGIVAIKFLISLW